MKTNPDIVKDEQNSQCLHQATKETLVTVSTTKNLRVRFVACIRFLHHWHIGKKSPACRRWAMGHKSHVVWWPAQSFFGPVEIWALPGFQAL
jgi:hypothetical protein